MAYIVLIIVGSVAIGWGILELVSRNLDKDRAPGNKASAGSRKKASSKSPKKSSGQRKARGIRKGKRA